MTTIREELPEDIPIIRIVNERAFGQPQEADVIDALRTECEEFLSLVAVENGQVVGHILFTPATIEYHGKTIRGMGLAPLAVLPDFQKRGIGSQLTRVGLSKLRERFCPFIIVLGHPEYYPRFGFEPASKHGLHSQWEGIPDEAFMALILDEKAMRGITGVARYRNEFDAAME